MRRSTDELEAEQGLHSIEVNRLKELKDDIDKTAGADEDTVHAINHPIWLDYFESARRDRRIDREGGWETLKDDYFGESHCILAEDVQPGGLSFAPSGPRFVELEDSEVGTSSRLSSHKLDSTVPQKIPVSSPYSAEQQLGSSDMKAIHSDHLLSPQSSAMYRVLQKFLRRQRIAAGC